MDALSSLTSILKPVASIAGLGSTAYNLYNQYQNQQYQNLLRSYAQNPAKMQAYAQQFTQPLNAGLTADVSNSAQAYLAQRGLSDSPAVSQQVESQAIAPYIQQNQQQGYQDALQALGLGGGAIPPGTQQQTGQSQLAQILAGAGPGNQYSQGQSVLNMAQQQDPSLLNYPTTDYSGLNDWFASQPAGS
jgi:hypothetical protein